MTCVGFVDMLGFTALTEELEPDELGATVTTFETRAYETVAEHGGRVIKTIGDEVMFTVEASTAGVEIALRIAVDEHRGPLAPEVRAGVAQGPVLAKDGDCPRRHKRWSEPCSIHLKALTHVYAKAVLDQRLDQLSVANYKLAFFSAASPWHSTKVPAVTEMRRLKAADVHSGGCCPVHFVRWTLP
jgi:hypothetical protein